MAESSSEIIGFRIEERKMCEKYAIRFSLHSCYMRVYRRGKQRTRKIFLFGYDKDDILYKIPWFTIEKMVAPVSLQVDKDYKIQHFKRQAKQVHGDKYDYSLVEGDVSKNAMIKIICPKHGMFRQKKRKHITDGRGCPACGREKIYASSGGKRKTIKRIDDIE